MGIKFQCMVWITITVCLIHLENFTVSAEAEPGLAVTSIEMQLEKPARPKLFSTPEELKAYVAGLAKFYSSASRNRFGKRFRGPRVEIPGRPLQQNDLYELLQDQK